MGYQPGCWACFPRKRPISAVSGRATVGMPSIGLTVLQVTCKIWINGPFPVSTAVLAYRQEARNIQRLLGFGVQAPTSARRRPGVHPCRSQTQRVAPDGNAGCRRLAGTTPEFERVFRVVDALVREKSGREPDTIPRSGSPRSRRRGAVGPRVGGLQRGLPERPPETRRPLIHVLFAGLMLAVERPREASARMAFVSGDGPGSSWREN